MTLYFKCLRQYSDFYGRARRAEFWTFWIVTGIVEWILINTKGAETASYIFSVASFCPSVAVTVRRLHDTGRTGWALLLAAIPGIGAILLFVFWVQQSHASNQYGPTPDGVVGPKPWKDLY